MIVQIIEVYAKNIPITLRVTISKLVIGRSFWYVPIDSK